MKIIMYPDAEKEAWSGKTVYARSKEDLSDLDSFVDSPERYFENLTLVVKDSRTTKAGIATLDGEKKVFIKRHNNKSLRYTLRYLFRPSRAFRVWRAALALEESGLPTPKVLCAVVEREMGVLTASNVVTEVLDRLVPTVEFFERAISDESLNDLFVSMMVDLALKAHERGIYHGDLKLSNFFVRDTGDENLGKRYEYGLWDLDAVVLHGGPLNIDKRSLEIARLVSSYIEIGERIGCGEKAEKASRKIIGLYSDKANDGLDLNVLNGRVKYLLKRKRGQRR